jgi:hypothetical protein
MAKSGRPRLASAAGIPVTDNQNCLVTGPCGPLPVQGWQPFEPHTHSNRERIPQRAFRGGAGPGSGHGRPGQPTPAGAREDGVDAAPPAGSSNEPGAVATASG